MTVSLCLFFKFFSVEISMLLNGALIAFLINDYFFPDVVGLIFKQYIHSYINFQNLILQSPTTGTPESKNQTSELPSYEEALTMEKPKSQQSWREGHHTVIIIEED